MFVFPTNRTAEQFCLEIASAIALRLSTSFDHAVDIINTNWGDIPFDDEDDLRYHETPDYWARVLQEIHREHEACEAGS